MVMFYFVIIPMVGIILFVVKEKAQTYPIIINAMQKFIFCSGQNSAQLDLEDDDGGIFTGPSSQRQERPNANSVFTIQIDVKEAGVYCGPGDTPPPPN